MDLITISHVAKKVLNNLFKNGGVGYVERKKEEVVFLPEMTVATIDANVSVAGITTYYSYDQKVAGPLYEDTHLIIIIDGVRYERTAYANSSGYWIAGNGNYSDGQVTGPATDDQFAVEYINDLVFLFPEPGEHTVSIYKVVETETIHPIDPKFIPEKYKPFEVSLSSLGIDAEILWSNTALPMPEENIQQLMKAIDDDRTIIVYGFENGWLRHYRLNYMGTTDSAIGGHTVNLGGVYFDARGYCHGMFVVVDGGNNTITAQMRTIG